MNLKQLFVLCSAFATFFVASEVNAQVYVAPGGTGDGSSWDSPLGSIYDAFNATSFSEDGVTLRVYIKEGTYSEDMENPANADLSPSNMPDGYNMEIYGGFDELSTGTVILVDGVPCGYDPANNVSGLGADPTNLDAGETWFRVDDADGNLTVKGLHILDATNDGSVGSIANIQDTDGKTYIFEDLYISGGDTSANGDAQFAFDTVTGADITFNNVYATGNTGGNSLVKISTNSSGNTLDFTNSTVTGYDAAVNGAAIDVRGDAGQAANIVTVDNSFFCSNSSGASLDGGALYFDLDVVATVTNNTFYANEAVTGGEGGAIEATNGSTLTTSNNIFDSNLAENGGAVSIDGSKWTSTGDVFVNNDARNDGGAANLVGNVDGVDGLGDEDVQITGAMFYANEGDSNSDDNGSGGAIWTDTMGRNLLIQDSEFLQNTTSDNGGAIFSQADIQVFNCKFKGNVAKDDDPGNPDGFGGAIFSQDSGSYIADSCFDANESADGGSAIYVDDGLTFQEYFTVPAGITTSNGATLLRHINYNNSFTGNIAGVDTLTGDDAVGGAVVYEDVRNSALANEQEGNIAVVGNDFYNNVLWSETTPLAAAGLVLRGIADGTDGDNIVAFQNNTFAGNTRAADGETQSATVSNVDVSIENATEAAIFNTGGTAFQLAPTPENYPLLDNPALADWEGIDTPIFVASGDASNGIATYDISLVNVLLNGTQIVTGNTALGDIALDGSDVLTVADATTGETVDNDGDWAFLGLRTATAKTYDVNGQQTNSSGAPRGDFTPFQIVLPAWTQDTVTFENTDTTGADACDIVAPTPLTVCPSVQTGIEDVEAAPPCDCIAEPSGAAPTATQVGISTLDRDVEAWLPSDLSAYIALESDEKGFVITRNADPAANIATPEEGMIVWDTTIKCLKMYYDHDDNGTLSWECINDACTP